MGDVDVLIPTLRRPQELTRALRSVFAQDEAAALMASIVVVDNSPEASSAAVVEALRPASPAPLIYVHAPHPGVATARNAGLAASRAPLVAFIDDDEEAPTHWLRTLRAAHLTLGATVTFGPVQGIAEGAKPQYRDYLDRFFSRRGGERTELIDDHFGCGNSIMTRAVALAGPEPFDVIADLTGGEDDRLFDTLRAKGALFGWAAEAPVLEYAPPHRAHVRYALRRAFCYGQSPSQTCIRAGDWLGLARWVAIGAGQVAVFGSLGLVLTVLGRPRGVAFADKAVRGLGKILWFLTIRLYGLASAPHPPHAAHGEAAPQGSEGPRGARKTLTPALEAFRPATPCGPLPTFGGTPPRSAQGR